MGPNRTSNEPGQLQPPNGQPIISCAIDDVAIAARMSKRRRLPSCSNCSRPINGRPAATGLFMWTRGDEVRYDEPPLCSCCASTVTMVALHRWHCGED